ncbi:MAG: OmpA family protein [Legionellaceae bacterium]|nr:OmpA family protein [Legionellaceae bacterium]
MSLISKKIIKIVLIAGVALGLVSCQSRWPLPSPEANNRLPRKVEGADDREIVAMQAQLLKQNIKVISMGQNYLVSIPANKLFADQSPRLTWHSYASLNQVIDYLKQFRIVSLYVRSFSSQYVSAKREQALTSARSRAVADYFQSQGVDSRLIFTSGIGSDKPIMRWQAGADASPNARVEITFRRQVA